MIEEKGEPAELGWPGSRRPARVGARAREGGAWAEKASGGQEPPDGGGGTDVHTLPAGRSEAGQGRHTPARSAAVTCVKAKDGGKLLESGRRKATPPAEGTATCQWLTSPQKSRCQAHRGDTCEVLREGKSLPTRFRTQGNYSSAWAVK